MMGNMNPVTLVNIVVSRNSAVQPASRLEPSMPTSTIKPLAIAIRLMMTCSTVNA